MLTRSTKNLLHECTNANDKLFFEFIAIISDFQYVKYFCCCFIENAFIYINSWMCSFFWIIIRNDFNNSTFRIWFWKLFLKTNFIDDKNIRLQCENFLSTNVTSIDCVSFRYRCWFAQRLTYVCINRVIENSSRWLYKAAFIYWNSLSLFWFRNLSHFNKHVVVG